MPQQNPTWDLGRFVKTLSYYGAIPFLSDLDWFQEWFGSRPHPQVDTASIITPFANMTNSDAKMVLVGGTGAIAQQVMQNLMADGGSSQPQVRVLPFTANQSLAPDILQQTTAILIDAADSTPQFIQALTTYDFGQTIHPLFDFTQYSSNLKEVWGALDDVVMGGVSESSIRFRDAIAEFSGNVSIANSGGFASVRTRNFEPAIDLSSYDGIALRVKSDGNRYKFMLRTESRWDGVAHCHSFDTVAETWITVRIPFTEFIPVLRAKTVSNTPLDTRHVNAFQLMLSKFEYDGALNPHFQPGSFQLQIESINGYGRTLADISKSALSDIGKGVLFPQLIVVSDSPQMDEIVRQVGIPYTVIRPSEESVDLCIKKIKYSQGNT
jgi:Complex I intermediate-associated protein 30 (CIA30)